MLRGVIFGAIVSIAELLAFVSPIVYLVEQFKVDKYKDVGQRSYGDYSGKFDYCMGVMFTSLLPSLFICIRDGLGYGSYRCATGVHVSWEAAAKISDHYLGLSLLSLIYAPMTMVIAIYNYQPFVLLNDAPTEVVDGRTHYYLNIYRGIPLSVNCHDLPFTQVRQGQFLCNSMKIKAIMSLLTFCSWTFIVIASILLLCIRRKLEARRMMRQPLSAVTTPAVNANAEATQTTGAEDGTSSQPQLEAQLEEGKGGEAMHVSKLGDDEESCISLAETYADTGVDSDGGSTLEDSTDKGKDDGEPPASPGSKLGGDEESCISLAETYADTGVDSDGGSTLEDSTDKGKDDGEPPASPGSKLGGDEESCISLAETYADTGVDSDGGSTLEDSADKGKDDGEPPASPGSKPL